MNNCDIGRRIINWRAFCLVLILLTNLQFAKAQVGSTYAFTQSTDTYTAITGGTTLGTATNDDHVFNNSTAGAISSTTSTGFAIGFNFVYNGVTYNKFAVNTNGWIILGTGTFTIDQTIFAISDIDGPVIAGMSMDLVGKTGAALSYSSTGTAPDRKLVVQWKGYSKYTFDGNTSDVNFQIVLHETSNSIDIIYGSVSTPEEVASTAQVGIKTGLDITQINNRTGITGWGTTTQGVNADDFITFDTVSVPESGLTFSWAPIACTGTPTAGTIDGFTDRSACLTGTPDSISVTGANPLYTGITYQWEQSTDAGANWANAVGGTGATTATYAPPTFAGTEIQYRLTVTCANGGGTASSDAVTLNPPGIPASQATDLTLAGGSYTDATLSWANGSGSRRVVYLSTAPITDPVSGSGLPAVNDDYEYGGTGQQLVYEGTDSSISITGLTCGTTYYAKVFEYTRCGSGPYDMFFNITSGTNALTFTSPLEVALPVTNTFANYDSYNLGNVATGWFESYIETDSGDVPGTANPIGIDSAWVNGTLGSTPTAKINLYSDYYNDWIISPKMAIAADSRVRFKAAITDYDSSSADDDGMDPDDEVKLLITTDCGATWAELYTFNAANTATLTNALQDFSVLLPASYVGETVQVAFQATDGPVDDGADYDFHIANVVIEAVPNCENPMVAATTNITKDTATINWNVPATGIPTGYEYVVSETNTTPVVAGTPGTGTTLTADVTGLNPLTTYYVFVRTVCGGDFSDWSASGTFTTLCNYGTVTANTPASRCGAGEITLGAEASAGSEIQWFDTLTGGTMVGSGEELTTSVNATTTFYATSATIGAGMATVGTGGGQTDDTEVLTAFCNRYSGYKMQIVYTAAELNSAGLFAGNITSLAFNISSLGDSATNSGFTVKMGASANAVISSADFVTTGLSTVYGPATYTHTASGWQNITFTTPYAWDGTSNILVQVSHNGANLSDNAVTYYTETAGATILYSTGSTSTDGNLDNRRLDIMFGGQAACRSPRTAVIATIDTPPALTLSENPAAICIGETTAVVEIATGAEDYDTYVWTPAEGVSGDAVAGWTFNPSVTTTYTLQASQTDGSLCNAAPISVIVSVNALPSAGITVPAAYTICQGSSQALTLTNGATGAATIGTGSVAPGTLSYPNPFSAYYGGAKTQILFTAQELTAQGLLPGSTINKLSFQFNASAAFTLNDLRIKIGTTTNQNTDGGLVSSALLTTVYNANYTPTAGTAGLVAFTLTTPYTWNGGNVIVEIAHNQGNSGNGAGTTTRTTQTSFNSVYTAAKDNVTPAGVTSFDSAIDFGVDIASNLRPNVVFGYTTNNTFAWSPVTNLYTDAAATTAYTGQSVATVYTKPGEDVTYTATIASPAGCEITKQVAITVTITPAPEVADDSQEFCEAGTVADLLPADATIKWYSANTGGTALAATTALEDGVMYYASQTANGCESMTRTGVTAVIHTVVADAPENVNVCSSYELPALTNGAYFTEANGQGTEVAVGTAITETTTLYVFAQVGEDVVCTDENTFIVTVANVPGVEGAATQTINGDVAADATIADLIVTTVTNGTVTWYATEADAMAGTNPLSTDTQLTQGATYYAVQTVGECSSADVLAVTVDIVLGRDGFDIKAFIYHPNPVKNILNISYSSDITSVTVFNLLGQQVITLNPNNTEVKVDMSSLADAPYVVNVTSGNSVKTIKIVKRQ